MLNRLLRKIVCFCMDIYLYLHFPRAYIAYRGVFDSFEAALKAKPKTIGRATRYEEAKVPSLEECLEELKKPISPTPAEYPLLFWLNQILHKTPDAHVCDFGGGRGRHYFAFCATSSLTPKQWSVCELPQNVARGKEITSALQISNLTFESSPKPAHILLSSGAFQYIESLYELLKEYFNGGGATPKN